MNIQIRKATKADAESIALLAVQMWTSHTTEELADGFSSVIENENSIVYLLTIDEVIVGFAQCGLRHDYVEGTSSSPVGYLEGIFVKKEYRKQGYAKQLLNYCEQWAKEKSCNEFASDCELSNEISRQFHMNLGFKEANRIICFTKKI
ncbi:MAG: GNAT family N-acetyltransferase [Ruminococcus sp.]|nr:GNAT family N-acetyltransferase [Ruminococcus sp.]